MLSYTIDSIPQTAYCDSNTQTAEVQKTGMATFRTLSNEEALQECCSPFVFLDSRPASLEQGAKATMPDGVARLAKERSVLAEGDVGKMRQFAE
jgi:hypothetical protein